MTDNDLHSRLVSSLTARLDRARAATPGPWRRLPDGDGSLIEQANAVDPGGHTVAELHCETPEHRDFHLHDSVYIAANAPDVEIRRVEATLRVVQRCAEILAHASHYTTVESCDELDAILAEQVIRDIAAGEGIEP